MIKKCNGKFTFVPAEGATHVENCHNIGETLNRLVKSFTHVENCHNIGETLNRLVKSFTHVENCHNTRRVAFTLAEVLITLGIIGVVSAMTIPTLISNYNDKVIETRKVKAKSVLANAFNGLRVEAGGGNLSTTDISKCEDEDCFEGELRKVFKIASKLDMNSDKAKEPYSFANGQKEVWSDDKHFVFLLPDGTIYGIEKSDSIKNGSFSIVLDLNGHKTPNIGSEDLCRYLVNNTAGVIESCETMKEFIVKSCPEGAYLANNKCNANDVPNCKVQSQAGVCTECMDNYELNGTSCRYRWNDAAVHSGGAN